MDSTMGVDRWITLGRIEHQVQSGDSICTDLQLIKEQIRFGDIIMQKCTTDDEPHRNYHINSFLGDNYYGCYIKPMVDPEKLSEQTEVFLNWLSSEAVKHALATGVVRSHSGWNQRNTVYNAKDFFWDNGMLGDTNRRFFYPVSALLGFDYNQVAVIGPEDPSGEYESFIPDPKGETYLQKFEASSWRDKCGWMKFLNKLRNEKWDFVIFTFSN